MIAIFARQPSRDGTGPKQDLILLVMSASGTNRVCIAMKILPPTMIPYYGKEISFTRGCRYDFFGINPATGSWLCMPIADKTQDTIQDASKMPHRPDEDSSKLWIRSDSANEISVAAENAGASSKPTTPHRSSSNIADRAVQTFEDLNTVNFMRSGFSPSFRPILSIGTVQLFNLFRQVERTDVDGVKRIQAP